MRRPEGRCIYKVVIPVPNNGREESPVNRPFEVVQYNAGILGRTGSPHGTARLLGKDARRINEPVVKKQILVDKRNQII